MVFEKIVVIYILVSTITNSHSHNMSMMRSHICYIFFPRVILYIFFLLWLIYGGLGFWGRGLILGFWGWGFQLMGFGACGVGPSGFLWLGLSI